MTGTIPEVDVRDAELDLLVLAAVSLGENFYEMARGGLGASKTEIAGSLVRLMGRKWVTPDEVPSVTRTGRAVLSYSGDQYDAAERLEAAEREKWFAAGGTEAEWEERVELVSFARGRVIAVETVERFT